MIYILGGVLLIGIAIVAIVMKLRRLKSSPVHNADNRAEGVAVALATDAGNVQAHGNLDEFIITVGDGHTFLVKDGVIVGYKDSRSSQAFKEYSGR